MTTAIANNLETIGHAITTIVHAVSAFLDQRHVKRDVQTLRYLAQDSGTLSDQDTKADSAATDAEVHSDQVAREDDPHGDRDIDHIFGRLAALLVMVVEFVPAAVGVEYLGGDVIATVGFTTILVVIIAGCILMTGRPRWRPVSIAVLVVMVLVIGILRYLTFTIIDGDKVPAVVGALTLTIATGGLAVIGLHFVAHTETKRMSQARAEARRARLAATKIAGELARVERRYAALREDLLSRAKMFFIKILDTEDDVQRALEYFQREIIGA